MAKRYWLFKSEPGCFSIHDLASEPRRTTSWDGVRNYQARNMLRDEIKKGDGVFFYNSNCKLIGIAGICEVVKEGYPDHTAMDPDGQHFDPKVSKENPIWYMVDVKLKEIFGEVIPLTRLKETAGLENMVVTQRGSRLSIQPVTAKEWKIITSMKT
ncbi:MAG: EVE domain-containing protein [bacterium]|nr:EVE domain-containing protein [bacterium]